MDGAIFTCAAVLETVDGDRCESPGLNGLPLAADWPSLDRVCATVTAADASTMTIGLIEPRAFVWNPSELAWEVTTDALPAASLLCYL